VSRAQAPASGAGGSATGAGTSVPPWDSQWPWASWSAMNTPVPSHHGQATVDGLPPRLETTVPIPRQAVQGDGSGASPEVVLESLVLTGRGGYSVPGPLS